MHLAGLLVHGFVQDSLQEGCDLGGENSDQGECTSECKAAVCGDGKLWSGMEQCDDGDENGDIRAPPLGVPRRDSAAT